jgi:hypothetical protein
MSSNTQKKGDIIINPNTQRPVKVGSRTWLKMVKDGLIEGRYSDPNELYTIDEKQDEDEVESKIKELNKTLPYDQHSVRGRGKYKDKLVKRNKQPNPQELTQHTAKTASRIVSQNMETLSGLDNHYDIEKELERMILEEMMTGKPKNQRITVRGIQSTQKPKNNGLNNGLINPRQASLNNGLNNGLNNPRQASLIKKEKVESYYVDDSDNSDESAHTQEEYLTDDE